MHLELKRKAVSLRTQGYSYAMILKEIPVSKSTLSYWLRNLPFTPNKEVLRRTHEGLLNSVMKRHQAKLNSIEKAQNFAFTSIGKISNRDLMMFGLGIYLGEGSKRDQQTKIINSDPRVLKLMVLWLTEIYKVPMANLVVTLHLYPDSDEARCTHFWSKALGIPGSQFLKTQVDQRKDKSTMKYGKLPYGTAHVRVRANGTSELGILLFRKIMSEIEVVFERFGIIIPELGDKAGVV